MTTSPDRPFTDIAIDRGVYANLPLRLRDVLLHVENQHAMHAGARARCISIDFAALVTRLTDREVQTALLDLARRELLAVVFVVRARQVFAMVAPTEREALVALDQFARGARQDKTASDRRRRRGKQVAA
jgi:hypothetical protein